MERYRYVYIFSIGLDEKFQFLSSVKKICSWYLQGIYKQKSVPKPKISTE